MSYRSDHNAMFERLTALEQENKELSRQIRILSTRNDELWQSLDKAETELKYFRNPLTSISRMIEVIKIGFIDRDSLG